MNFHTHHDWYSQSRELVEATRLSPSDPTEPFKYNLTYKATKKCTKCGVSVETLNGPFEVVDSVPEGCPIFKEVEYQLSPHMGPVHSYRVRVEE